MSVKQHATPAMGAGSLAARPAKPVQKPQGASGLGRIGAAWRRLNEETIGGERYWSIALQNASVYADTVPLITRYVRGKTRDVGAGRLAWRYFLRRYASDYVSGDMNREHPELDLLFDATRPYPFAAASFDTVFCYAVLEHTREPWRAFAEMWRVLRPGGVAIVAVPFIFYLHGQPHDYYRFTPHGLRYLAERAGFKVEDLVYNGGMVEFMFNIPSVALSSLLAGAHLQDLVPYATRFWLALGRGLGRRLERGGLFATNLIVVLRKPDDQAESHAQL